MLFTNVLLLGTASVAAAFNFKRDDLQYPIELIPATCNSSCTTYKEIFNTCPDDSSAAICAGVCNGTVLTDLQVCINCTLIEGSANNVTQFNIDVLNAAQQSLAQECVNEGFPATFTGTFAKPTTVAYPSGIDKATFIGGSSSKPVASATASANSSAKANATNPAAPSVSGKLDGSASALSFSAGAVVVAAAAALLL